MTMLRHTIMSSTILAFFALSPFNTAQADWRVTQDGAAILENGGNSSLSLRCDNNSNTHNQPGWLLDITSLDLKSQSPRMEVEFRFPNRSPIHMMADNRNGHVTIDSMEQATQGDLLRLVHRLKAANRVSVTLISDSNGSAMDPLSFSLKGSSRTIEQIERACR